MTVQLHAVRFGAADPGVLARFWAGVLGRRLLDDPAGDPVGGVLLPGSGHDLPLRFVVSDAERWGPNQTHFDLTSSSPEEQQATVARVLELGGRHLGIGQGPDVTHVVMADPEGNELCVIAAGNNFLADTAAIGALSSDGTQEVGYFWAAALDWPLVWDQDEETAIQSPTGGSKISWGGPPVRPKLGPNPLQLELAPSPGDDLEAEVDRLVGLGATLVGHAEHGAVALTDPDGNELWVVSRT